MAMHQFKCNIPSSRFVFKSGKVAHFNCGIYNTESQKEIDELNAEVAEGHPHITAAGEITAEQLDPMSALRAKIIEEYKASAERANNPNNDMGSTSTDSNQKMQAAASTKSIAPVTAGSVQISAAKPASK